MTIPIIFGAPIHLWMGILLFILILFQVAVAKKIIPAPFIWHRIVGFVILFLALIHGLIAMGLFTGFLRY